MVTEQGILKRVDIDRLELDLENPRHGKLSTPEAAITYLVEKERVVELAVDIAKKGGTNPMDLLGVVAKKSGRGGTYISAEGNRRVCALMLLHDPEKVPVGTFDRVKKVRALETAASKVELPRQINCIVFSSKKEAMPWIELMHIADQDGRARKRWTADQQANAIAGGRNYDAMQLLDLAERLKLIDRPERDAKLTTVQRYLGNPVMRATLGLERSSRDRTLSVTANVDEFHKVLDAFIDDVKVGKLSSRSDAEKVKAYAAGLAARVTWDRTPAPATPIRDVGAPTIVPTSEPPVPVPVPTPPPRPPGRTTLVRNADVDAAIFALNSQKITSLYMSCVSLPLKDHSPLITVGLWCILESLATLHAGSEQKFYQYFNPKNIEDKFGVSDRGIKKALWAAVEWIADKGNATKHNGVSASFDAQQLSNNFDVLAPLLIAVSDSMKKTA